MLSITKRIAIATSLVAFYSGSLYASDLTERERERPTINSLNNDILRFVIKDVCTVTNPRCLTSVSKLWFSLIRERENPEEKIKGGELKVKNLRYVNMYPFMKSCMVSCWENLFYNGVLEYEPGNGGETLSVPFAKLKETNGTFDISAGGQRVILTTNIHRFFTIGGENEGLTVIGVFPRFVVEDESKKPENNTYPLSTLLAQGDPDLAPVHMVFRWGNFDDLTWIDSLTTSTVRQISSRSLFENRQMTGTGWCVMISGLASYCSKLSCVFLNRNEDE